MSVRLRLTDSMWNQLQSVLTTVKTKVGRPPNQEDRMFIEAVLYVGRTGLPWRDLPQEFGRGSPPWQGGVGGGGFPPGEPTPLQSPLGKGGNHWSAVYNRLRRQLQIDELSLADNLFIDSACVRAHQHAAGAPKKGGQENQALGLCRGGFSTKIHLGRCGFANAISIVLTGGQTPDVKGFDAVFDGVPVNHSIQSAVMDKGYDSLDGRQKLQANRLRVVIPPKKNRVEVIDYDKELYKPRNRVERFINRIKQFRRIAARYDKLAETFVAFLQIVAVYIAVS